jgi:aminoglycoside 3-N-acetyltransferase
MGPDFPIPRESEEPLCVTLIDAASRHIPYVMSPPLSRKFVLKIERLATFIRPGVLTEWKYRGVSFYCTEASEINRALGAAASSGKTLYLAA